MKDIQISGTRIKREIIWLLGSLLVSIIFNIYSIIKYNTAWKEMITQLHVVIILAVIIYFLLVLVRLLAGLIIRFTFGKKS